MATKQTLFSAMLNFLSSFQHGLAITCSTKSLGFNLGTKNKTYFANLPPSNPTNITISTFIFDVSRVDDFESTFSLRFISNYGWNETRIRFTREGIYGKTKKSSEISPGFVRRCMWHPGIHYLFQADLNIWGEIYSLSPNGMVTVEVSGEITIQCVMKFDGYPFDIQSCYLQAVPKENIGKIKVDSTLNTGSFQKTLQYEIVGISKLGPTDNVMAPTQGMTVRVDMKRRITPYLIETFVPTLIMVIVSWISLIMPPDVIPGRAGLLITLTLVVTNISLNLIQKTPRSERTNQFIIWVFICLGMIIAALSEYAVILFFLRNGKIIRGQGKAKDLSGKNKTLKSDQKESMEPLSKKIDCGTLVVLAITFALFNLYFWSTNSTELDRPFPIGDQYLENAKYPMTVRNATKVLLGKVDEEFEDEDWPWDEKE